MVLLFVFRQLRAFLLFDIRTVIKRYCPFLFSACSSACLSFCRPLTQQNSKGTCSRLLQVLFAPSCPPSRGLRQNSVSLPLTLSHPLQLALPLFFEYLRRNKESY